MAHRLVLARGQREVLRQAGTDSEDFGTDHVHRRMGEKMMVVAVILIGAFFYPLYALDAY